MLIGLRKLLGGIFAFEALCPLLALPVFIVPLWKSLFSRNDPRIFDGLFQLAFFAFVFAIFGMACWTVCFGKRWARGWGFAASLINVLAALPAFYWRYGSPIGVAGAMALAGIVGMVVFSIPFKSAPRTEALGNQSIKDDGTNAILNKLVWLIGAAIGVPGAMWWAYWRRIQMLPEHSGWAMIVPVLVITLVVHELGHVAAAWATEMKVYSFVLGPLDWRIRDGRWKFAFSKARLTSVGGAVGIASTRPDESRWHRICIAAGGPVANLVFGGVAFLLALAAKDSFYENSWGIFADIATIGIGTFILNLIPLRVGGMYSDGARIYQSLSGGMWADYWRVHNLVSSTMVTALRPRDYDLESIERLAANPPTPLHLLLCRLYEFEYHLDRGEMTQARQLLEKAQIASQESEETLTSEICSEFVYSLAYLNRDAGAARAWWDRLEAKKPAQHNWDYWLAHSALHWIEGNLDVANRSWLKGNAIAQQLPQAGAYDFDRYRFILLRQAIDKSAVLGPSVPVQSILAEVLS
jgi:hypothetical protein